MNIAYIANIRIPTEKAHGYQIMRVCSELSKLGSNVTLYVPDRANNITQDTFEYYGLEKNFSIVRVRCFDWVRFAAFLGPLAFKLQSQGFLRALEKIQISKDVIVYTRDAETVEKFARAGYTCIYNAHNWPMQTKRLQKLLMGVDGVVANSKGTEAAVRQTLSVPTTVLYNASDPNQFVGNDKKELREKLGLPADAYIALYAGHLYGWKGAQTVFAAAKACPEVTFVCIGGTPLDVKKAEQETRDIKNIHILGHKPKADVPAYLAAADVLLLPNTKTTEESVRFTSPIKMFEYMASGTPVIASDLPSLREILSNETALFVEPEDPRALAKAVQYTSTHQEVVKEKARKALVVSGEYTWTHHARNLVDFLKKFQ